jgi:hypothetical protein
MKLEFDLGRIEDPATAAAFQRVRDFIRDTTFLKGDWKFFDITFDNPGVNTLYPHGLTFTPKDVIQIYTSVENGVVWNYDLFDGTNINIDVMIPCNIRAFIGRYTP